MERNYRLEQKKHSDAMRKTVELTDKLDKQLVKLRSAGGHSLHDEIADITDLVSQLHDAVDELAGV